VGYVKHESLVVVGSERGKDVFDEFIAGLPEEIRHHVVGPSLGVNGLHSWCFMPDGSKQGWNHSDLCRSARRDMARLADEHFCSWSWVFFGGDDEITRHVTNENGWSAIPEASK
jgi:hypothetical protein